MVGPGRPLFVLFGSSIVQLSYGNEGWGAILAHTYTRKVFPFIFFFFFEFIVFWVNISTNGNGMGEIWLIPRFHISFKKL